MKHMTFHVLKQHLLGTLLRVLYSCRWFYCGAAHRSWRLPTFEALLPNERIYVHAAHLHDSGMGYSKRMDVGGKADAQNSARGYVYVKLR
jgi:hypothetical protein